MTRFSPVKICLAWETGQAWLYFAPIFYCWFSSASMGSREVQSSPQRPVPQSCIIHRTPTSMMRWENRHIDKIRTWTDFSQKYKSFNAIVSTGKDWASYSTSWKAPPSFLLLPRHLWHQRQDKCQTKRITGDPRWVKIWSCSLMKHLSCSKLDRGWSCHPLSTCVWPLFSGVCLAASPQRRPPVIPGVQHPCLL